MTATTPLFGWPYPEPSDARGAGAIAIRDGLLAVETDLTPSYMLGGSDGAPVVAPNASAYLPQAVVFGSPEWAYDAAANGMKYTGPMRWFVAHLRASFQAGAGSTTQYAFVASLRVNGVTHDSVSDNMVGTTFSAMVKSLHLTTPMRLETNDVVQVHVQAGATGATCAGALRLASIGPKLA